MQKITRFLLTFAAAVFLFFSWLWDHLHPIVRAIVAWIPLEGLKRAIERLMARLTPYQTLVVFLVPLVAAEPLKIASLWFFAKRQWALGTTFLLFAELVRYGLVAYLFTTCRDKLLSIPWFARMYGWFLRAHAWAHELVDPVKQRLRLRLAAMKERLRAMGLLGGGGLSRRIAALRRLARRPAA